MALNRRVVSVRRNQIIHWLIVIALVVVTIDIFVGNYQSRLLAAKRAAQAEIERMAWFYVRIININLPCGLKIYFPNAKFS